MKKLITLATIAIIALSASMTTSAQRGYRGFVDAAAGYEFHDQNNGAMYGIATTHGYQMNNWFIGGGVSVFGVGGHMSSGYNPIFPIYIQGRYDYSIVSEKSFFSLARIGYDPKTTGPYLCLGGGLRIALNRGISGINVGLNLHYRNKTYPHYWYYNKDSYGLLATVGFEF